MPIASKAAGRDAIQTLFKTAWDAQTPPVPVVLYEDVVVDIPPATDPWVRVTVRHGPSTQVTLGETGGRRFRRLGVVTVQVFTPVGDGMTLNDTLSDVAVNAFEGKSTGGDEVEFRNVTASEVGVDSDWFQTNVTADFEYDAVK